jgi:predicted secreted protein
MASIGRAAVMRNAGTIVAGVGSSTVTWNGEVVDTSSNDSNGRRTLLNLMGTESIDISIEGLLETNALRNIALGPATSKYLPTVTFTFANGDILSGAFVMASFEEGNTHNGATTFSATFNSANTWTWTPF